MRLLERQVSISRDSIEFPDIADEVGRTLADDESPVRFNVTRSIDGRFECEIGVAQGISVDSMPPVFAFRRREYEDQSEFNVVFVVPTGIGAEIGGHAGDATPAAIAIAEVADTLITHPNVVNASDINELPPNGLYVEGSVLSRLLMGTAGLRPSRSNRVLVAIDSSFNPKFGQYSVNAVNAGRATYGLNCPEIMEIDPPLNVVAGYTASGRASGTVEGLAPLLNMLSERSGSYDAIALVTVIEVPTEYHYDYFTSGGEMVNPWGGVEALLTHAVSSVLDLPAAHSPMMESDEVAAIDPGIVDARMAAEIVSMTFLQCVLKGLHRAPRIVTGETLSDQSDALTAEDVDCLVIPDGCLGIPTLAALHQGIRVITVRESRNLMRNDLSTLPWAPGQLHVAENYWEAAGILAALKAGIDPASLRRPMRTLLPGETDE